MATNKGGGEERGPSTGRKRRASEIDEDDSPAEMRTKAFEAWHEEEQLAEKMIPLIGELYRAKNVITSIHGRSLIRANTIEILKSHSYARKYLNCQITIHDTFPILVALSEQELPPSRVCLGTTTLLCKDMLHEQSLNRLTQELVDNDHAMRTKFVSAYLAKVLKDNAGLIGRAYKHGVGPRDVVLYGFGRIGRYLARILIEQAGSGKKLMLRAVVVRPPRIDSVKDLEKRASLLRKDSVHGPFAGTITVDRSRQAMVVNGVFIQLIYAKTPADVDYTAHGINDAIVIDNTGIWRDREGLGQHLKCKGVSKVLLTAPSSGPGVPTVVAGINDELVTPDQHVYSAASCTTNATVCVLKVIAEKFGIVSGHLETVHSYTNDQNLIDNYHPKARRGRSAPLNMVITETGAAKAIAKVVPELAGKLTAQAIRVPTPNVSLAILMLSLERKPSSADEVNEYLRQVSLMSQYQKQVDYVASQEAVSSDFVGNIHTSIVDAQSTSVAGDRLVLKAWYDNEAGYSYQVIRIAKLIAGFSHPAFPPREGVPALHRRLSDAVSRPPKC